jgi:hypothetical protein
MSALRLIKFQWFFALAALSFGATNIAFSQEYSVDYTLKYINSKIQNCEVSWNQKNNNLLITYFSKGEKARVDQLFIGDLDVESVVYSVEESAVIVRCAEQFKDCVKREILTRDAISYYPRTNLSTACSNNDCVGLTNAIKHLIYLHTVEDYQRTKPFEVNE